jgi:DNA-directed RNA polymerase subunit beta
MGDEDDDLLRAAEELGIDLSGVRTTDGQAADESEDTEIDEGEEGQTEDEEATDAGYIEADADAEAVADVEVDAAAEDVKETE